MDEPFICFEWLVVWPEIDDIRKHLNEGMLIKLRQRLCDPVGTDKSDIGVDPGGILPAGRQALECNVDKIFLVPDEAFRAQLDVAAVATICHRKILAIIRELNRVEHRTVVAQTLAELLVEPVSRLIAKRVRYRGDDIKLRHRSLRCTSPHCTSPIAVPTRFNF